jgi:GDP-mannose 6-dehydrogenase
MRVIVWGLGYVGTVSAACLAQLGHEVIGVEPNLPKVEALNAGHCAIKEPGLEHLVSQMVAAGRLRATQHGMALLPWANISLICVGTPAAADGSLVLDYACNVAREIGQGLHETVHYHVVVLRSTVFPGTMRNVLGPLLAEHCGRQAGRDFGIPVRRTWVYAGTGKAAHIRLANYLSFTSTALLNRTTRHRYMRIGGSPIQLVPRQTPVYQSSVD